MTSKAQIHEYIEEEKASLRKLSVMYEDILKLKERTERRIKEWEKLLDEF